MVLLPVPEPGRYLKLPEHGYIVHDMVLGIVINNIVLEL